MLRTQASIGGDSERARAQHEGPRRSRARALRHRYKGDCPGEANETPGFEWTTGATLRVRTGSPFRHEKNDKCTHEAHMMVTDGHGEHHRAAREGAPESGAPPSGGAVPVSG